MIVGIKITPLKQIEDDRGKVMHMLLQVKLKTLDVTLDNHKYI